MFDILIGIYCIIETILMLLMLPIGLCNFYEIDNVLTDISEFLRFVFQYQVAVYELTSEEINKAGIIILEVITTFFTIPYNLLLFCLGVFAFIIKYICILYAFIFRNKDKEVMIYESNRRN